MGQTSLELATELNRQVARLEMELRDARARLAWQSPHEPPSIEPGEAVQVEAIVQVTYHRSKVAPSQDWYIDAISEAIDPEDILGWRPTKP
jgi:hypothetical protein